MEGVGVRAGEGHHLGAGVAGLLEVGEFRVEGEDACGGVVVEAGWFCVSEGFAGGLGEGSVGATGGVAAEATAYWRLVLFW